MSKGDRNRKQAREKIAQLRAQEARRRRRRNVLAGAAATVVIAGAGITLAVVNAAGGSPPEASRPQLRLAALSTLGPLNPAPTAGPAGPEAVPIPAAAQLTGTATAAAGAAVDGISCQRTEQTIFHIHAHLTIFVNGSPRQVPAGVGIPAAQSQNTAQGPFIGSGTCFYWLHTHAADGIIHIESPVHRTYTLGNFFDVWGQPLGPHQVGPATGPVIAIYNGKRYVGNPRDIPLNAQAQIQLEVGTPLIAPQRIVFPPGL